MSKRPPICQFASISENDLPLSVETRNEPGAGKLLNIWKLVAAAAAIGLTAMLFIWRYPPNSSAEPLPN